MRITLSAVTVVNALSDETTCFTAQVLIDGVLAGHVSNRGTGGAHAIQPVELESRLTAYAATLPPRTLSAMVAEGRRDSFQVPASADGLIDEALDAVLVARDLRKLMKSRIVYVDATTGTVYQTRVLRPTVLAGLLHAEADTRVQLKASAFLNTMPFEAALDIYRRTA
jgi:hypothetical protein